MHKSKLIVLLGSFKENDWQNFNKFMRIHVVKGTDTDKLYRYLYKNKVDLYSKNLLLENVKNKVFNGKSKKGIQNVISKLILIVEDYMTWDWYNEHQIEKDILLLQAFNSRGLFKQADLKNARLKKLLTQNPELGVTRNINEFRANHIYFNSSNPSKDNIVNQVILEAAQSLSKLSNNASFLYQTVLESTFSTSIDQKIDVTKVIKSLQIEEAKDETTEYLEDLFFLNRDYNLAKFTKLFDVLIEEKVKLTKEIRAGILLTLRTRCAEQIRNGNHSFHEPILALYEYGIKSEIFLVNKKIKSNHFANITSTAAALGKTEWSNRFITKYAHLIEVEYKKETVILSKLQILFHQNKYSEVLEHSNTEKFNNFSLTLMFRWTLLCCQFKVFKEDSNFLSSVFRNFNNFITNNKKKISNTNIAGSRNLCKILVQLTKNYSKEYLHSQLSSQKQIVYRVWLQKLHDEIDPQD